MPRLLAADAQRSDDPDLEAPAPAPAASPGPNLETAPNMHRVTGTFADPSHESTFAAQLFRMAYPAHAVLLAVVLAWSTWNALVQPELRAHWVGFVVCGALPALVCRVLLHRTEERMEQLQAEKERLLYDMQRRGRPLDDDDDRSAVRRGLQAARSQPYPDTDPDADASEAGGPASSDSLPTLPPGPPSSASSGSAASIVEANRWWQAENQRHAAWIVEANHRWQAENQRHAEVNAEAAIWARSAVAEDAARAATLAAPAEFSSEELIEWVLSEMEPDKGLPATPASTMALGHETALGHEEAMAQLKRAIWLADKGCSTMAPCRFAGSSSRRPSQEVDKGVKAARALKQKFDELVMCDYTPRNPKGFHPSKWVGYDRLYQLFWPHAPSSIWQMGPGNLKQQIIEWYKDDPCFTGLAPSAWCRRVATQNVENFGGKEYSYRFCFEYTPMQPGL